MNKKLKLYVIIITIISLLFLLIINSFAEESEFRSLIGDYFNKVFDIELNNGSNFLSSKDDLEKREKINNEIFNGNSNKYYSLYDRFGGDIKFIPYFGEIKIKISAIDVFYTLFANNELDKVISFKTIIDLLTAKGTSLNVVYKNRPDVLDSDAIKAGYKDPRVSAYNGISILGGEASLSNFLLAISKTIVNFTAWLSDSKLFVIVNDIFNNLVENIKNLLEILSSIFLTFGIIIFILALVSHVIKFIKNGNTTIKQLIFKSINCLISLGIIYFIIQNPGAFSDIFTKSVRIIDEIFDSALNEANIGNEVINSSINDNIRIAYIWEKAIFNPWCNGMFQDDYNRLYTQFESNPNKIKMNQSHDDVLNWYTYDNDIKYNSKDLTGDITIPLGNGVYIRNWAALAWSCQSIYHIDAHPTNSEMNYSNTINNYWPKATTCPYNSNIYIDNFRWLDAKLNISPEYHKDGSIILNYTNSNLYQQTFLKEARKSLYLALLLIPIILISFKRFYYVIIIVSSGVRLWYYSIIGFFLDREYNILYNFKKIITPIYDYFWWSMICFINIILYKNIAGNNILSDIIYILISIYLIIMKPIRTTQQLQMIKYKAKYAFNKIKNKVTSFTNKK